MNFYRTLSFPRLLFWILFPLSRRMWNLPGSLQPLQHLPGRPRLIRKKTKKSRRVVAETLSLHYQEMNVERWNKMKKVHLENLGVVFFVIVVPLGFWLFEALEWPILGHQKRHSCSAVELGPKILECPWRSSSEWPQCQAYFEKSTILNTMALSGILADFRTHIVYTVYITIHKIRFNIYIYIMYYI